MMKTSKKHRLPRIISLAEDLGMMIPEDAPFRIRLHHLFAQIEKEFELLYLENLHCKTPLPLRLFLD